MAVILDPFDRAVFPNQHEGVAGFAAGRCPAHHPVGFGNGLVAVREQGGGHPILRPGRAQYRDGVGCQVDQFDIEGGKFRAIFQIDDLVHARRSTIRHAEIQQDRLLAEVIRQGVCIPGDGG